MKTEKQTGSRTINLKRVLDAHQISKQEMAGILFPDNAHQVLALNRVIRGEAMLDERQISTLADTLGTSIDELYTGSEWGQARAKGSMVVLTSGDYRAELDTRTWISKVYKDGNVFKDFVLSGKPITLREYIAKLDEVITSEV